MTATSPKASAKETFSNPYLNARREWDERYGDFIARARNWRHTALGALAIAAMAVGGVVWIGSQSKIQPYVVQVDDLGGPVAVAMPVRDSQQAVTQRVAEALVSNWIWEARTVLGDPNGQKVLIDRVYGMAGTNAAAYLSAWYRNNPPMAAYTKTAYIRSVLAISQDTYQVTWDETKTQLGQQGATENWKANVTVGIDPKLAESPKVSLPSPMGLYIRDVSWTRVFAGAETPATAANGASK
jgi:type IV secretion system protein VirB5